MVSIVATDSDLIEFSTWQDEQNKPKGKQMSESDQSGTQSGLLGITVYQG